WRQDLRSAFPAVRCQAAAAFGQWGDRAAVVALAEVLKDSDASVRREAAKALGQLKDDRAVPGLIKALGDTDANVRFFAAYALGEIKDPRARDALLQALADPQWMVRDQAAWALRELRDPQIVDPLVDILKQPGADTATVMWLLQQLDSEHSIDALASLLAEPDPATRLRAVRALADVSHPRKSNILLSALNDPAPSVRMAVIKILVEMGDPQAREALERQLAREKEPAVAGLLEDAITRLSPRRHLAAWWSFDDRSHEVAKDVTGNGNDGQICDCPVVDGRIGAALQFGEGRFIELGKPVNLPIANQPFTVTAWARSDAEDGVVVARGGAFCGFSLYLKDGVAKFGIRRDQEGPTYIAEGKQRVVGDWVHLAGVLHQDRIELYVNARLAATARTDGYIPGNCGQGMEIGFDVANSAAELTDAFQGILDEVKFFHAALSEEDIATIKEQR
ncbi:MAG: HEAT repeat domain-containing protein, partial [Planctomycetes bacterium]|nr:HEAT repeat domain-containing protein [Planctomycetota bacterium]